MRSDTQTLESLCVLITDCPHSTPVWTDSGFVVLRNQNIKNGRLDLSSPSFTDSVHFAGRNRRAKPTVGDIVITREAPMGDVCMIPEGLECCLGQRQVLLRPNPSLINPRFLHFALQSPAVQNQISWSEGTGSTVSNLRIPVLKALDIPNPPRAAQDLVASTLGALDDRIDLLRQTNTTLEAIAQALFKSWFVDFDPVRAKAEGREPEGMDAGTAALFPSGFEQAEKATVPKGWRYISSGEIYNVGIGKTPPRKEPHWFSEDPDDVRWASIRDMGNAGCFIATTSEHLTREAVDRFNVRVVPPGTVLLSFKLTVGRIAITDGEMATNEAIAHFKPTSKSLPQTFLYCYLKSFDMGSLGSTSSIADATNSKAIRGLPILLPSNPIVSKFDHHVSAIFEKIRSQQRQIQIVSRLRDTLLPRLISGNLRLPDATATVEEAIA